MQIFVLFSVFSPSSIAFIRVYLLSHGSVNFLQTLFSLMVVVSWKPHGRFCWLSFSMLINSLPLSLNFGSNCIHSSLKFFSNLSWSILSVIFKYFFAASPTPCTFYYFLTLWRQWWMFIVWIMDHWGWWTLGSCVFSRKWYAFGHALICVCIEIHVPYFASKIVPFFSWLLLFFRSKTCSFLISCYLHFKSYFNYFH